MFTVILLPQASSIVACKLFSGGVDGEFSCCGSEAHINKRRNFIRSLKKIIEVLWSMHFIVILKHTGHKF